MKCGLIVILVSIFCVCQASAETAPVPIDALEWFEGCTQITQPANGMIMDTNCADLAAQYCVIGRLKDRRIQCLADLSEHMVSLSAAIKDSVPPTIEGSTWQQRSYERMYLQLAEDVFEVCDASPTEEIPPDAWCDLYLNAGDWVKWRSLQRLTLEVKQ